MDRLEKTLQISTMSAPGSQPRRWVLWLHGVFGSGQNFRGLAKQVCAEAPDWGACLVDLRAHGESQGLPPPHTLSAAAADVLELAGRLDGPIEAVVGHSFGGKVALEVARHRPETMSRLVVLDASPSARPDALARDTAGRVLAMLEQMPWPLVSRDDFIARIEQEGYPRGIAQWLAMNVRRQGDGYRLRNDLDAIRSMLGDYFATDSWSVVEDAALEITMVIGGRSEVLDDADRARAHEIAERRANVSVVLLPEAEHWVHVDEPEAVCAAVLEALG